MESGGGTSLGVWAFCVALPNGSWQYDCWTSVGIMYVCQAVGNTVEAERKNHDRCEKYNVRRMVRD